jgi:outer membrane usher protein
LTTSQFIRMGMSSTQFLPSLQAQAFVGIPLKDGTSVGVSYTQQNNRDTPNNRLVSVNYGRTVAKHVFLSVSGIMNIGGQPTKSVFLNLSFPLDARTSVNASATKQQNLTQGAVQVTRSLPADIGYGYSVRATQNQGQGQDYQATVSAQNSIGTYTAQAEQQFGQQNYRAGIRGGVALMGGDMYLSRQITGSFGVVQVPGHENVGVYAFNRLVARTNRKGNALIPNLLPYQPNPIRIDPTDLPMDAHINETELNPVPRYKSGVLLQFSAKTSKGALIKLVQASGAPVPLGAMVQFVDVPSEEFPVASEGETYLIGLKPGAHTVKAAWDDEHSCIAEINYPETNEMVPDLGEALCR